MRMQHIALVLLLPLLAACGSGDKDATTATGEDGLPKPAAAGRSVTGMPDPGVAQARPAASTAAPAEVVELPEPVDAGEIAPVDPAAPPVSIEGPPVMVPESTMPTDPDAPPPAPEEEAANRTQDDARQ